MPHIGVPTNRKARTTVSEDEGFYAGSKTMLRKFYRRHLRYPLWRLANLNQPYEQYYADLVSRRIARGGHDAIGPTARAIRDGSELLDVAVTEGLQPQHRFVDYGCGSLRLGKPVVDYLAPENFIGMDVTQRFLDLGRDFLGPDLLSVKRPDLAVTAVRCILARRLKSARQRAAALFQQYPQSGAGSCCKWIG